jgi:hypothetical protein
MNATSETKEISAASPPKEATAQKFPTYESTSKYHHKKSNCLISLQLNAGTQNCFPGGKLAGYERPSRVEVKKA